VHQVVGIEGRLVTARALAFAKENLLAAEFGLSRLGGIELAKEVQLWRRRKIQHLLKIGHEVNLAAALQRVYSFLRGNRDVAVEISRALLEFGKILDGFQRSLRPEEPLDVQTA